MLPDLVGYADRWSAKPGGNIDFMIHSANGAPFDCQFVRILCGDPNPEGLGYKEEEVACSANGRYQGQAQTVQTGSWARVDAVELGTLEDGLAIEATIWPTTPAKRRQGLIAWSSPTLTLALILDGEDGLTLEIERNGSRQSWKTNKAMLAREWYDLRARLDPKRGRIWLEQIPRHNHPRIDDAGAIDAAWDAPVTAWGAGQLVMAALPGPLHHYNGKLERPTLRSGAKLLNAWDFSRGIETTQIFDIGPRAAHGVIINLPTRAMKGANWSGREMNWTRAPEEYGAIHFHETDMSDCGWPVSVTLTVPSGWRSGIYAARLRSGEREDLVPFCVRPKVGRAPVVVLLPTFTYQVYGSYVRPGRTQELRERATAWNALVPQPDLSPEFGLSTYNYHSDGSGVSVTSLLRPMLDTRPKQVSLFDKRGSGCGRVACDSYLIHWLEHLGQDYEVVTDHDLHAEGAALLQPYRVVITGQHPEYYSTEMLDGLQGFLDGGGRLMYLGGNGFYWKTVQHKTVPTALEVRRAEGGIRVWPCEPGEYYHSFNGEYGGLWVRQGRAPNKLVGIAFSSQGYYSGYPYRFADGIRDPRAAFMVEGIDDEATPGAVFGDYGFMGGGAAGFELDRADRALGTPPHALIVARGRVEHPDYGPVNEDMLTHKPPKPLSELICADMTFFETRAGGAVFSVGSMTYLGSLGWNSYDNTIAKLTTNVLRRFVDERPF